VNRLRLELAEEKAQWLATREQLYAIWTSWHACQDRRAARAGVRATRRQLRSGRRRALLACERFKRDLDAAVAARQAERN
jgi:hypothetical protein